MRQLVAPLYLLLCLILGGSAQGIWANMVLQLLGLAIIAWAAIARGEPLLAPARQLLIIVMLAIAVVALELIPLPASLWPHLGGRETIAADYHLLGLGTPPLPLSLTPHRSLDSLFGLIPPLAVFCAVVRLKAYRASYMAAALVAGVIAGVLLGALQVASPDPQTSPWYLYKDVNFRAAVGFFANANHMAILLVITVPFLAALVATAKGANIQRYSAFVAAAAGAGLVVLVGLALNGSLAGYGLALSVLPASALIVLPMRTQLRRWLLILAAVLVVLAVAAIAATSVGGAKLGEDAATSVQSREEILATTVTAIRETFPWGTGLGSFRQVYTRYEDPRQVTRTFVIHAHNDYAELILETGIAGLIVLGLFLIWWGAAVRRVWETAEFGPFARAASVASAAILVHSIVDFPLRTAAVGACFGMCLAFLADRRSPQVTDASDLRPTRHVTLR